MPCYLEIRQITPNATDTAAVAPTKTQGGKNSVKSTPALNAGRATVITSHSVVLHFMVISPFLFCAYGRADSVKAYATSALIISYARKRDLLN